jgi:hypothetical protein
LCIQQAKNIFLKLFTRSQIKLIFATRSNFRVYQFEHLLGLWQVFSATQFTLNPGIQPFISTRLFNPVTQPGDST